MSLDSLAAVEARIATISAAFSRSTPPPAGTTTLAGSNEFAQTLARATSGSSGSYATGAPSLPATASARAFVTDALRQEGKPYIFGAEVDPSDTDPDAFDCSELVQWAARRQGVEMREGSWEQYVQLKEQGATMSVEEALRTPGALLFSFPYEPKAGQGRPPKAHVAISLGDGRTIEARGRKYGVGVFTGTDRFQYAARIPQFTS